MKRRYIIKLLILGMVSVLSIILCIVNKSSKGYSLGIIGRADGPTRIVVAESGRNILLYVVTGIVILTFTIACIVILKKK